MIFAHHLHTTELAHRHYAAQQNIVIERYQPIKHERGAKKLMQQGLALGCQKYITNLKMLEVYNKHHKQLMLWIAYKTNKNLVVGFTWLPPLVYRAKTPLYVHHLYKRDHIARLIADKALQKAKGAKARRTVPFPSCHYFRYALEKAPENEKQLSQQPYVLLYKASGKSPHPTLAIATFSKSILYKKWLVGVARSLRTLKPFYYAGGSALLFSTLQQMYYEQRVSCQNTKKLLFYLACYYAWHATNSTIQKSAAAAQLWLSNHNQGNNLLLPGETVAHYAQHVGMQEADRAHCLGKDTLVSCKLNDITWEKCSPTDPGARPAYLHPRYP